MQKSIIKYMISDFRNAIITYIVVIVGIFILVSALSFSDAQLSINGFGFSAMIFMFVATLSTLPMGIRYLNQSGFSRKTAYKNYIVSFSLISLFISLLLQIILLIEAIFISSNMAVLTEYNMLFGGTVKDTFFPSVIWLFLAITLLTSISFFLSMLYQKMEKKTKIFVSCGFPIFFMLMFPILDAAFLNGVVYKALMSAFLFICGIYNGNSYPLLSMGMFLLISIVFYAVTYIVLVRKLNFS